MARRHLFTDEAGDFAFNPGPKASRYFIVCSVTMEDCSIGESLLRLRRELEWAEMPLGDAFHASTDKQAVRDEVFKVLADERFRIDATILEKSKAQPHIRASSAVFYQYAWFYHFKGFGRTIAPPGTELHLTTASIGTKKNQAAYTTAVNNVVQQVIPNVKWVTTFTKAASDPCLQVADYCTWAIQRKWERNDPRSYDLIKHRIFSEFDLWRFGDTHYY